MRLHPRTSVLKQNLKNPFMICANVRICRKILKSISCLGRMHACHTQKVAAASEPAEVENLVFGAIDATSTDYLELMKSQVCRLFTTA